MEVEFSRCRNVDDEIFVAKQGSDSGVTTIVMQMCLTTKPAPLACLKKIRWSYYNGYYITQA